MPLATSVVGMELGPRQVSVTPRLTMAYAAGIGDHNPIYFDDTVGALVAPPMYAVTLDWPIRPPLIEAGVLSRDEWLRGVHATHDLRFHRPIRAGDELTTRGRVVLAEPRKPGAYLLSRFETVDAQGQPVCTIDYGSLYRGIGAEGAPRALDPAPPLPALPLTEAPDIWVAEVHTARTLPHIYTECADIYNPIHTELAVALAAGLPDIILHGTATLALAARELLDREGSGDPGQLLRLAGRFSAMVIAGTPIRVRALTARPLDEGRAVWFVVENAEGTLAIQAGVALFR